MGTTPLRLGRLKSPSRVVCSILGAATVAASLLVGCDDPPNTSGTGGGTGGGSATNSSSTSSKMSTTTTTTTGSNMTSSSSGQQDVCGDGNVTGSEDCDDGDTAAGDGCDDMCTVETGWDCSGDPSICAPICGDGIVIPNLEACDDMNAMPGDGCDMTCKVEHGFTCDNTATSVCTSECGDGLVASDEECDDDDTDPLDGCDANCDNEDGWSCTAAEPSVCMETGCGDGFMVGMEACDDGNQVVGDGCSAGCALEMGFNCMGTAPTICASVCGDGLKVGMEQCDDNNMTSNDCCSSCNVDAGCETELNNSTATADDYATTALNQKIHGFINPVGDDDYFVFTIPAGMTFDFRATTTTGILGTACDGPGISGPGIDSNIELLDSAGMLIDDNDDGSTNYCSDLTVLGLTAGTYYIKVEASSFAGAANTTFDYDLNVTLVAEGCPNGFVDPGEGCDDNNSMAGDGCSPTCQIECPGVGESEQNGTSGTADGPISPNVGNCGSISPIGDKDFFSVTLTAYSDLSFETFDTSGTTCNGGIDTVIEFYAPNGTTVLTSADQGGINDCSKLNGLTNAALKHLAPGTYFIAVTDYLNDGTIPGYQLKMTVNAQCGNNTLEGSEQCDGTPGCGTDCVIIPVCGNGTLESGEQCDQGGGNVANGDGCSSGCQIEPGFSCMGTPSVCMPAGPGVSCSIPLVATNGYSLVGSNIAQYGDDLTFTNTTSCQGVSTTPGTHPDIVFQIDLTAGQKLTVKNFGTLDMTWDLVQPCAAGATTCLAKFDGFPGAGSSEQTTGLVYTATATGTHFVVVESYTSNPLSTSTYDIRFAVTQCGNGVIETGELCDQGGGNVANGDGCSATCQVESGYTCMGTPSVCTNPCGNGTLDAGELCDDGNMMTGDGCSTTCTVESPFLCTGAGPGSCTNIMSQGDTCALPINITTFPSTYRNTNFNQFGNDIFPQLPSCQDSSMNLGRDVIFKVTVPAMKTLTVTGVGSVDTLRHILPSCDNMTACSATADDPDTQAITYVNSTAAPVDVFVVDENYSTTVPTGAFGLNFTTN